MPKAPAPGTAVDATVEATLPGTPAAWASALNLTVAYDEIAVTLLTLAVVDDLVRLTGLLRVRSRSDVRIATIPSLDVNVPDGGPLRLIDARVQPHGRVTWVSWTYERPATVPGQLEARIERVELEYRLGGTARVDVPGPWIFSFAVRPPTPAEATAASDDGDRRA